MNSNKNPSLNLLRKINLVLNDGIKEKTKVILAIGCPLLNIAGFPIDFQSDRSSTVGFNCS